MYEKRVARLFRHLPRFKTILVDSETLEVARSRLLNYMDEIIESNLDDVTNLSGLQFSLGLSCVRTFRIFLAKRTVKITTFDVLEALWLITRGQSKELSAPLSDSFFEDLTRIFDGIGGKAQIYKPAEAVLQKGRKAAIARSEMLNEVCRKSEEVMKKYCSGLDQSRIKVRDANRKRIRKFFNCSESEFNDYNWQLNHIIRDLETLEQIVKLSDKEKRAIRLAKEGALPFGITPYYASLFEDEYETGFDRAVRAQVIPPESYVNAMLSEEHKGSESLDFMREADTSPIDLITRRYPRIAILKPCKTCSQICVYCQRNWEIDDAYILQSKAKKEKLDAAIDWIERNPALSEILVTGGDPLVMTDESLAYILDRLAAIKNLKRIRIGTRTPVVLPQRFTENLVKTIARHHKPGSLEISVVTHFEHSLEVTEEAMNAIQKIRTCGIGVYNQAVFTMFNSRRFELAALRKNLRLIGVEPYYTFNAKGKKETDDYRVPLARLQQEIKEEARLLPGLDRTDEPVYNVPGLGKNYLRAEQNHLLLTILPDGRRVYEFHPWEKFLRHAKSYIHIDVPIFAYLKKLEAMGEKIEDYKSIYYYF